MTQEKINFGSFPGDPLADTTRVAFEKCQSNFNDLYQNGDLSPSALSALIAQANTIGGLPMDNTATTQLAMSVGSIVQQLGDALPAAIIANNPNLGTSGYFWTAADAAAIGTVNVPFLFVAAANWSSTNMRPVRFPAGVFDCTTTINIAITQPNVTWVFDKGARIQWSGGGHAYGTGVFKVTGNGFTVIGGQWGGQADTYGDVLTGLILTSPVLSDIRTACFGYWEGVTNYGYWTLSSTQLTANNSNTLYFDTLPSGYTLASLQAQANVAPIYLHSNPIINQGSYIANGSAITYNSGLGVYQVIATPGAGYSHATTGASWAPVAAIAQQGASSVAPAVRSRGAVPAPSIYLLSAEPVYNRGNAFNIQADNVTFIDADCINMINGQFMGVWGNRFTCIRGICCASSHVSNGADINIHAGDSNYVIDRTIWCGDQAMPLNVGTTWNGTGWNSISNESITNNWYINCRAISWGGSGPTACAIMNAGNSTQYSAWASTAAQSVGNTLVLPVSGQPSGITTANLQYSAPAWGNSNTYTSGVSYVVNNGNQYVCSVTGVSSATSSGPSGTGTGIADGTCQWNYVGGGGNAVTVFVYLSSYYMTAGAAVTGPYTAPSGGNYTLNLSAPGAANAIVNAIPSGKTFKFIPGGTPIDALTASVTGSGWFNCVIHSSGGVCIEPYNSDSTGQLDVSAINCTLDSYWSIPGLLGGSQGKGSAIRMWGGDNAYCGPAHLRVLGGSILAPVNNSVGGWGGNCTLTMDGVYVEPPVNLQTNYGGLNLNGAQEFSIKNSRIWSGAGMQAIELGGNNYTNGLGQVFNGSCSGGNISGNKFYGAADGQYVIGIWYGANHRINSNIVFPATQGGTDTAAFIVAKATSGPGFLAYDANDLSNINGTNPVHNVAALTLYPGLTNVYSPNATSLSTYWNQLPTSPTAGTTTLWNNGGVITLS